MAWRNEIKPASFRGIRFYVDSSDVTFGRRNAVHEYAYKDTPYVEDLGRKAKEFSFSAYFLGDDYLRERNRFIQVIESNDTAGTLIHPTLGTVQVKPQECSFSDSGRQGGKGVISLSFIEAGENAFPLANFSTDSGVFNLIDKLKTSIAETFPEVYSIAKVGGFVINSAIDVAQGYVDQFNQIKDFGAKVATRANLFKRKLASFEDNLNLLTADPVKFITETIGLFDSFALIFDDPIDKYNASIQLGNYEPSFTPSTINTPSRVQETKNNNQIIESFRTLSLATASEAIAENEFESKSEMQEIRIELLDEFEERIEQAGINEQDNLRRDTIDLRSRTISYLDESGASLPEIKIVSYNNTIPAYFIANELYGDSLRYEEIVNDNNIQHPLFVPLGDDLQVLTS
jgi:prophage DNA circulation protein